MALMSTKEHLKYVKGRINQIQSTDGKEMAFCMLRLKGTKDVLLHLDKASQVGKYKNPSTIQHILRKTAAFKFEEHDPFFQDLTKLVSLTGLAKNVGEGKLCFETRAGKATEGDLALALRLSKIKDYSLDASAVAGLYDEPVEESETKSKLDRLDEIAGKGGVTISGITKDPGAYFSSLDEMLALIEELRDSSDPVAKMTRETVSQAYQAVLSWSADGIEPVSDALEALADVTDFGAELADLEEAEALSRTALQKELADIRAKAAELLRTKGTGESIVSLLNTGKLLASLSEGHFLLAPSTTEAAGGLPLLLVSASATFDGEQQDKLKAASAVDPIRGRFKKSKSGKKIAIICRDAKRALFRKVFASLGMALDPYIVDSFDDLQDRLQTLKAAAAVEDLCEEIKASSQMESLRVDDILGDLELLDIYVAFAVRGFVIENVAFVLAAEGLAAPPSLPAAYRLSGNQAIYEAYVNPDGAEFQINIPFTERRALQALAARGDYAAMSFTAAAQNIRQLMREPLPRFRKDEAALQAIAASGHLRAFFGVT